MRFVGLDINIRELVDRMKVIDVNYDGSISYEEFVTGFSSVSEWDTLLALRRKRREIIHCLNEIKNRRKVYEITRRKSLAIFDPDVRPSSAISVSSATQARSDCDVPFALWVPAYHRLRTIEGIIAEGPTYLSNAEVLRRKKTPWGAADPDEEVEMGKNPAVDHPALLLGITASAPSLGVVYEDASEQKQKHLPRLVRGDSEKKMFAVGDHGSADSALVTISPQQQSSKSTRMLPVRVPVRGPLGSASAVTLGAPATRVAQPMSQARAPDSRRSSQKGSGHPSPVFVMDAASHAALAAARLAGAHNQQRNHVRGTHRPSVVDQSSRPGSGVTVQPVEHKHHGKGERPTLQLILDDSEQQSSTIIFPQSSAADAASGSPATRNSRLTRCASGGRDRALQIPSLPAQPVASPVHDDLHKPPQQWLGRTSSVAVPEKPSAEPAAGAAGSSDVKLKRSQSLPILHLHSPQPKLLGVTRPDSGARAGLGLPNSLPVLTPSGAPFNARRARARAFSVIEVGQIVPTALAAARADGLSNTRSRSPFTHNQNFNFFTDMAMIAMSNRRADSTVGGHTGFAARKFGPSSPMAHTPSAAYAPKVSNLFLARRASAATNSAAAAAAAVLASLEAHQDRGAVDFDRVNSGPSLSRASSASMAKGLSSVASRVSSAASLVNGRRPTSPGVLPVLRSPMARRNSTFVNRAMTNTLGTAMTLLPGELDAQGLSPALANLHSGHGGGGAAPASTHTHSGAASDSELVRTVKVLDGGVTLAAHWKRTQQEVRTRMVTKASRMRHAATTGRL